MEATLATGSKVQITLGSFAESKALYQAALEELKTVDLRGELKVESLVKDLFCTGFASKKIEACLEPCMKRVLYNGERITSDTFEPEKAREDYMLVCYEVAKANILPFLKSLYAEFGTVMKAMQDAGLA